MRYLVGINLTTSVLETLMEARTFIFAQYAAARTIPLAVIALVVSY